MRRLLYALAALIAVPAAAQSVKIVNPDTGLPVFSTANPAPITVTAGSSIIGNVRIDQTTPGTTNGTATTQIGSATVLTGNGVTGTGSQRVTIASDNTAFNVIAGGDVASGASDSGNPIKVGCYASSATPTGVADGKRMNGWCGVNGQFMVGMGTGAAPSDGVAVVTYPFTSAGSLAPLSVSNATWNGSTLFPQRGDANGTVTHAGLSSTYWRYTSGTSPILSNTTTAVTVKTAAGVGVKIALDSCQIGSTALGASVPIAFRDGAGGTVVWAMRPPAAGWLTPVQINFVPPLVGTANTLLEVLTTTADTSGTFDVNCQGHTET